MLGTVFRGFACSDIARRTPHLATQPALGLLPKRRTGLGSGNSDCHAFAGQDLSRLPGAPKEYTETRSTTAVYESVMTIDRIDGQFAATAREPGSTSNN